MAGESKSLVNQTASATNHIKEMVNNIQLTTKGTVDRNKSISTVVNDVNQIVSTIATAVEEQSTTTVEIARNVNQVSDGINDVNSHPCTSGNQEKGLTHNVLKYTLCV